MPRRSNYGEADFALRDRELSQRMALLLMPRWFSIARVMQHVKMYARLFHTRSVCCAFNARSYVIVDEVFTVVEVIDVVVMLCCCA